MPKENGSASGHGADAAQVRKAVKALLKYIGNEKSSSNNLFDDDEMLNLVCYYYFGKLILIYPCMCIDFISITSSYGHKTVYIALNL